MHDSKIFILEADEERNRQLREALLKENFHIFFLNDWLKMDKLLKENWPDLLVLGLKFINGDRWEICQRIRETYSWLPVIFLLQEDEENERIKALEFGADACLAPLFLSEELVARIHALLRRCYPLACYWGKLKLDCSNNQAFVGKQPLYLTEQELKLLFFLVNKQGKIVHRELLYRMFWSWGEDSRIVDVYVYRLRKKLARFGLADCIRTVRGIGYRIISQTKEQEV